MIDKLIEKIEQMKNPTVVGLDPQASLIPDGMGILEFNKGIIDAIHDIVPAVKPQIAFYEQHGLAGIEAYFETIKYAKQKEMIVIADIKRGDIASTAQAYADGHLGQSSHADFATINPYLGHDSITPWLDNCKKLDKGVFVLVKTSNLGSGDFQDLMVGCKYLYEIVGEKTAEWGKELVGDYGYSSVCAVVGATYPAILKKLRWALPNTFFLVPGYGAQGATARDITAAFDGNGRGAIINSSRAIIAAHKTETYANLDHAAAARAAAIHMQQELSKYLTR
ncbi:MAG: orotidine-5'-phosphate decarboxylase [Defluviitaleaceae bacterium]|nr:orotidine-5'-phosphate decarboxylase [Defluviitaleaceae bacterium]